MSGQTTSCGIQTRMLRFDLLENGIDFVKEGIERYFPEDAPDPRAHKYAILHLWSGTLLILKERLRIIDPELVYFRPMRPGDMRRKTVDFDLALDRLAANGVQIAPNKLVVLRTIQNIRNSVEHFDLTLDLDQAKAVIAELVGFLHAFCIDHLNIYIEDRVSEAAQHRLWELQEITDKLTEIMVETANYDAEADDAYFRSFAEKYLAMTPEDFIAYAETQRGEDGELTVLECRNCYEDTVIVLEVGICTTCREWNFIEQCHSCYVPVLRGQYVCRLCGP